MDLQVVQAINASPFKAFFAIAGGGQTFIGNYCAISGASNTVVGAIIPYNQVIFDTFIGSRVDKYASSEGARKLAVASYQQCLKAGIEPQYAVGIGASSSVVKEGERIGRQHRIIVAYHKQLETRCDEYILNQRRTRAQEDAFAAQVIFNLLAAATLNQETDKTIFYPFNKYKVEIDKHEVYNSTLVYGDSWKSLVTGPFQVVPSSDVKPSDKPLVVYCGSWNPIHQGHWKVIKMAEKILDAPVHLELSVVNTDKGSLDFIEIQRRNQMMGCSTLPYFLSNCPRYIDKMVAFRKYDVSRPLIFVVGMDTWNRIWDTKYGASIETLNQFFTRWNIKFLVFGRKGYTCDHSEGKQFCVPSAEALAMQLDYSSSTIRKAQYETT